MEEKRLRENFRKALRNLIEKEDGGNVSAFCQKSKIGYKPVQNFLAGRTEALDIMVIKAIRIRFPAISIDKMYEGKLEANITPTDELISTKLNRIIDLAIASRIEAPVDSQVQPEE